MSQTNSVKKVSTLSLSALLPETASQKTTVFSALASLSVRLLIPLLDRIIGLNKLRQLYDAEQLSGLDKQLFSQKLLQTLGVNIKGTETVLAKIPKTGACIVVCNHPYGMIEGVIIAQLLTKARADTKIMANVGLKIVKEIEDYFIFANP